MNSAHAVVLGAGIGGLCAARVAAEHYDRVTVVDRDMLSETAEPRRGVPQGEHAHDLLAGGQQAVEELFPGIMDELVAAGAPRGDLSRNVRWIFGGRPFAKGDSGLPVVASSRPFREFRIRERVRALPQVELWTGTNILRLTTGADQREVTGVRVLRDGVEQELAADVVLDTTGRGSRTPAWLAELGYPRVAEEKHRIDVGYVTFYCRTPEDALGDDIVINTVAGPDNPTGGSLQRVDGGRVIATAYGVLGGAPPTDFDGFREFCKKFAAPDMYEVLEVSEPISGPMRYRYPANLRRHYQRMTDFPAGLLVLGDAVCSFNPVYGHGMSVAAMGARVLRRHLGAGRPDAAAFFAELAAEVVDGVWEMAITSDLSLPGVPGERPAELMQIIEHVGHLQDAAHENAEVAIACLRVFGLVDPLPALMDPALLAHLQPT
ncbi:FAD-binding monooxygenase [Nocardia ninae]|uniref:FAD-binding monooxygenase n=1 Tax=Nocardia ninae NBRC 108245 TaxID=1210091 RepID=A0A511MF81_9NOCA|nr:FAD-binding monooxygenase [Nocardia ninae]GEM38787.1 FAD-binding monooxygenase [Nocardia ninae NBRC 108245]